MALNYNQYIKKNYNYINKYIINHGEKRKKPFFLNM